MTQLVALVHPFSPAETTNPALDAALRSAQPAVGPSSNTGQKSSQTPGTLSRPLLDFCTLVFDTEKAIKLFRSMAPRDILDYVFGTAGLVICGPLQDRLLNFRYERSATLIDVASANAGKLGISKSGEVLITLSGQGCQHVPDWHYVKRIARDLGAHLTRLDIAVDDHLGQWFDVAHFKDLYDQGAFTMNGRPPTSRHVIASHNKGCSLYIGQKGHKELNVYEKGKQLKDPDSPYVRCELRLYAKRLDLPLDALTNPGKYFGGAYKVLEELIFGELERLQVKENMVKPSAKAMVDYLNTNAGTALGVLWQAALRRGEEYANSIVTRYLTREGVPGRFKHMTPLDLQLHLEHQLDELFPELAP